MGSSDDQVGAPMSPAPVATERCAEERRLADERCELATRARGQAEPRRMPCAPPSARTTRTRRPPSRRPRWPTRARSMRPRRRPRAVPGGRRSATDPDALEAAARDWLTEINRINTDARDAAAIATREQAASAEVAGHARAADARGRRGPDRRRQRGAACLAAREAVAECDERAARRRAPAASIAAAPSGASLRRCRGWTTTRRSAWRSTAGGAPRIFRLLRGDRAAMTDARGRACRRRRRGPPALAGSC